MDPFALDVLADPLPVDAAIREAAPFVWLPAHGVWATGRHEEVARGVPRPGDVVVGRGHRAHRHPARRDVAPARASCSTPTRPPTPAPAA